MFMNKRMARLLAEIKADAEYTSSFTGKKHFDPKVMQALADVPREEFVPPNLRHAAYDNTPLPIGQGQTISQPYIVALMTDLLQLEPHHCVLEIGTGSGYQSAILALLCKTVYTVELIESLSNAAKQRLHALGYDNVYTHAGNGYDGWPEHAPYDGIIVTAAAAHIPQPLIDQLKPGGRLVIPVGLQYCPQELMLVERDEKGNTTVTDILGVAFVPLHTPEKYGR